MPERISNRERTLQSIADGFGGDLKRRRPASPSNPHLYQCGCEWRRNDPEAVRNGVTGDVIFECAFHASVTRRGDNA